MLLPAWRELRIHSASLPLYRGRGVVNNQKNQAPVEKCSAEVEYWIK